MQIDQLEQYLYENIPLSQSLGVNVELATPEKVSLKAPLEPNINHKKTVFGGSLHAVATLACWSLLFINLKHRGFSTEIVISGSEISYLRPVEGAFTATCLMPKPSNWLRFEKILARHGKARLVLAAEIYQGETLAVQYSGSFVALKQTPI